MLVTKLVILHVRVNQRSVNLTSEGVTFNYVQPSHIQTSTHTHMLKHRNKRSGLIQTWIRPFTLVIWKFVKVVRIVFRSEYIELLGMPGMEA